MKDKNKESEIIFLNGHKKIPKLPIIRFIIAIIGFIMSVILLFKDLNNETKPEWQTMTLTAIAILIIILHIVDKNRHIRIKDGVSIPRCNITNRDVKSEDDIFTEGLTTTNPLRTGLFNVHVETGNNLEPLTMCVYKTKGMQIVGEAFTIIEPDSRLDLDLLIKPEEKFNCQFDKNGVVKKLSITEIYNAK